MSVSRCFFSSSAEQMHRQTHKQMDVVDAERDGGGRHEYCSGETAAVECIDSGA